MTEREITRRAPKALTSNLFIPNYSVIRFPVPRRTDAPWCPNCGMTIGHWKGCRGVERAYGNEYDGDLDASGPGAASTARDRGQILDTRS
jgi:predicted RNA-binding Zn-ribbon protein involved in translation (DUF1610 family)